MLSRFVKRDGWEKWIETDGKHVWNIPDAIELPTRPFADVPERGERLRIRMFVRQPWKYDRWPTETVYVEDDAALDDSDRFGPDRPSLHRERAYVEALRRIRVITDADVPDNALGQAIAAARKVDLITRELRQLPEWLVLTPGKTVMPALYREGPPHQYWPVYDVAGRTVALCPDMQMAQIITKLLIEHAKKRRSSPTKGVSR